MGVLRMDKRDDDRQQLMTLLMENRQRIFGFIYSLVHHRDDAEDILQDSTLKMWEKFDEFQLGSDFLAWANQIAYYYVKNFRRTQSRDKVVFDDALLDEVSSKVSRLVSDDPSRLSALSECLDTLPAPERKMILARYEPDGGVPLAAEVSGRSVPTTYKSLGRIRKVLFDCISNKLKLGKH